MRFDILAAAMVAALLPSTVCGAVFDIAPAAAAAIEVEYRDGVAVLESRLASSTAMIAIPASRFDEKERPTLILGVENRTGQPINILASSVQVSTQSNKTLRVLTRDELVSVVAKSANGRARRAKVLATLGTLGAGSQTIESDTSGTISGRGSASADFEARTTTTVRNPLAAALAEERAAREIEEARAKADAEIEKASQSGFRAQTVKAGEKHITHLPFEPLPRETTALLVSVTVGAETHRFPLSVARSR